LNIGVSRNRFCDFLADPDSRSFSRFGAIIMQFAVLLQQFLSRAFVAQAEIWVGVRSTLYNRTVFVQEVKTLGFAKEVRESSSCPIPDDRESSSQYSAFDNQLTQLE
jgi:hypothetical protein